MGEMELFEALRAYIDHPAILSFLIFTSTFILEDAATLASGLLASYGEINPFLAYFSLLAGITIGDMGLYGLGYVANHFKWARKLQERRAAHRLHDWLEHRLILAVVVARFIPGARLTTYTTVGFFKLSFFKYMLSVFFASIVWTTILFTLIRLYGMVIVDSLSNWHWFIVVMAVIIFFIGTKLLGRTARTL